MMGFELIVPVSLIGVVVYALGWRLQCNQTKPTQNSQTAVEILNARFAGDLSTREAYEQMRWDLNG